MSKLQKILLGVFIVLLGLMVYAEATKRPPVNWFPSYSQLDKIPLGTFVLHDMLQESLGNRFADVQKPPFEQLKDSTFQGTYLFVNDRIDFDEIERNALLDWVKQGNTVFIAANTIGNKLKDTLQLVIRNEVLLDRMSTEPMLNLTNRTLKADSVYHIKRDLSVRFFEEIDTLTHTVLGVTQAYQDTLQISNPLINFIKAPVGKGTFYLHTQPEVFSNYFLLEHKKNPSYTENILSYINNENPVYWDTHYKSGKRINVSPLHVILNSKYLKWAYYIVLIGALLFVLFEGKRKQRSIPIVTPLTNKTYEYTQTISGMYIDKKEYHEIAKKQIALFFEYVRTQLRVPTQHMNKRFFTAVAARSGNTIEDTQQLFTFMEKVQNQHTTSEAELVKLYDQISTYKHKFDGKS